jgi:hypothetical protein
MGPGHLSKAIVNRDAPIQLNPLSSFAADYGTAYSFARHANMPTVVAVKVPASRVFSTAFSGPGCLTENEVVVVAPNRFKGGDPYDRARLMFCSSPSDGPTKDEFWQYKEDVKSAELGHKTFVANLDADLANSDWPKRTDDDLDTKDFDLKGYDPNEPRDRGRWTTGGGSSSAASSSSTAMGNFDKTKWESIADMGQRRTEWFKIPLADRDEQADASNSIPARQAELLEGLPKQPDTGDLLKDVETRTSQYAYHLHPESIRMIKETATTYANVLKDAGASPDACRKLTMMATDALAAQDLESAARQLGDHGIHHISDDIKTAVDVLGKTPSGETSKEVAVIMTALIWHDTGYMAAPSRSFLDGDHPRWSQQNFLANVREPFSKAFGKYRTMEVSAIIASHESADIDWEKDPVGSSVRVADNFSVFADEKLPPVFRLVPGNTEALDRLTNKNITLDQAHTEMRANLDKADLPARLKTQMAKAIDETSSYTGKVTMGMLGGKKDKMGWEGDHVVADFVEDPDATRYHTVLDLGQYQFGKLAKAWGLDPAQFTSSLNFKFERNGKVVLEGRLHKAGEVATKGAYGQLLEYLEKKYVKEINNG